MIVVPGTGEFQAQLHKLPKRLQIPNIYKVYLILYRYFNKIYLIAILIDNRLYLIA